MRAFLAGILSSEESSGGGGGTTFNVNSANLELNQYFKTDEYINTGLVDDYSFVLWANVDALSNSDGTIITYGDGNNKSLNLRYDNGLGIRYIYSNPGFGGSDFGIILSSGWHLIQMSCSSSVVNLYVDGAFISSVPKGSPPIASTGFYFEIGAFRNGTTGRYKGFIYENQVYNRELTLSEHQTMYNSGVAKCFSSLPTSITNDCVYAPRLGNYDNNTGQELVDQSASGIVTTNVNNTPFNGTGLQVECTPSNAQIFNVNSANLNGVDQYFINSNDFQLGTGDKTFSIWFKTSSTGTEFIMSNDISTSNPGTEIYLDSTGIHARLTISSSSRYDWQILYTAVNVRDGEWHNFRFATNRASNEPIMILDGIEVSKNDRNSAGNVGTGNQNNVGLMQLGRRDINGSNAFFNGELALFEVWDVNKTASEMIDDYNNPPYCYGSTNQTDLECFNNLGNWTGTVGQELIDQTGNSNDLTNVGSTPFNGTGLQVEC